MCGWFVICRPELYPTEIRSTGHAVSNAFARLGAVGASYWVASSMSNQQIAGLLGVVGVVGGLAAQARSKAGSQCIENSKRSSYCLSKTSSLHAQILTKYPPKRTFDFNRRLSQLFNARTAHQIERVYACSGTQHYVAGGQKLP